MPYKLVITKKGPAEEVTAAPDGWVVGSTLFWPRIIKSTEIEALRSDESSLPDKSWKKVKCRIKLSDISSYEEALRLEEIYCNFNDTEDEERYKSERLNSSNSCANQNTNAVSEQFLDVNLEFDKMKHAPNENKSDRRTKRANQNTNAMLEQMLDVNSEFDKIKQTQNEDDGKTYKENTELSYNDFDHDEEIPIDQNSQVIITEKPNSQDSNAVVIGSSDLMKIIEENSALLLENKILKESLHRSDNFQKETKKKFEIIETQLDKIIDLLQNSNHARSLVFANNDPNTSTDKINENIFSQIKFPIETKEQLDALENKLLSKDAAAYLVKKLSETCGTSGQMKISKIGLPLIRCLIKDELLNQFTWKGIKGCTKMAFVQYVKIRELFYKVAKIADHSCSMTDSDLFIQCSAIKHSGQRIKRKLALESKIVDTKKAKKVTISTETDYGKNITETEVKNNETTNKNNEERTEYGNCRDTTVVNKENSNNENQNMRSTEETSVFNHEQDKECFNKREKIYTEKMFGPKVNENVDHENRRVYENAKYEEVSNVCIETGDGHFEQINENYDKKANVKMEKLLVRKKDMDKTDKEDKRDFKGNNMQNIILNLRYPEIIDKKNNTDKKHGHGSFKEKTNDDSTESLSPVESSYCNVVTISEVKINNKVKDFNDEKKKTNISSTDVSNVFEDLIQF